MRHFIYSGHLPNKWSAPDVTEDLICAADKYGLVDLLEFLNTRNVKDSSIPFECSQVHIDPGVTRIEMVKANTKVKTKIAVRVWKLDHINLICDEELQFTERFYKNLKFSFSIIDCEGVKSDWSVEFIEEGRWETNHDVRYKYIRLEVTLNAVSRKKSFKNSNPQKVFMVPHLKFKFGNKEFVSATVYEIYDDQLPVGGKIGFWFNRSESDLAPEVGSLEMHFEMKIFSFVNKVGVVQPINLPRNIAVENAYKFMESLKDDLATADVTLVSREGARFHAHKLLLRKVSSVFEGMFRSSCSESESGVVNCSELSSKCIEILLRYFYSGQLATEWSALDTIKDLAFAAHYYDLKDLFRYLDHMMGKQTSVKNAQTLLNLTEKFSFKTARNDLLRKIRGVNN